MSPTEAFRAKGTYRKTPCDGATMTVWVAPLPELPEVAVAIGGVYVAADPPNDATHSVEDGSNELMDTCMQRSLTLNTIIV